MICAEHAGAMKESEGKQKDIRLEEKDRDTELGRRVQSGRKKSRRGWTVPFLFSVFSESARDIFRAENRLTREDDTHRSPKRRKEGRKKKKTKG